MFNKKDRHVIELIIKFNLTTINEWLNNGNKKNKINKVEDFEENEKHWDILTNDIIRSYYIDVLPNGQNSDMYFHREKGVFSENISGDDLLENVDEKTKLFIENTKIENLSWSFWHQYLTFDVNTFNPDNVGGLLFSIPLEKIVELQSSGRVKHHTEYTNLLLRDTKKIKVPVSFDSANQPKKSIEVWEIVDNQKVVKYSNTFCSVSVNAYNDGVKY